MEIYFETLSKTFDKTLQHTRKKLWIKLILIDYEDLVRKKTLKMFDCVL